ncbi:hypothetical protein VCHA43P277_30035 [Vibrio chagasii]|nr:hypothetical protein VCHA35P150_120066 [Vibrio chagasii]CAK2519779.1 hypothetical protein VCRA2111O136_50209 [Vibrio crassostreae]CAH6831239.1 hypothetical protein VCHA28FP16_180068 [Vibrio chagasii]CAH6837940.1 hypothetical protein VCHA35O141_10047 [Vibrio chagasii]CAH6846509.1 hypothetical protein VCHA32O87_10069 [Vibrio chagasii]
MISPDLIRFCISKQTHRLLTPATRVVLEYVFRTHKRLNLAVRKQVRPYSDLPDKGTLSRPETCIHIEV